jgi:hypothetical protein
MHNKQAGNRTPNSAANPLPTAPNSADGRSVKTSLNALIYKEFLTLRYLDSDAETFFPLTEKDVGRSHPGLALARREECHDHDDS